MERYQKEMNEIHAPKELIESTKRKCRQEELTNIRENRKKKKGVLISALCAAAILVIVLPAAVTMNRKQSVPSKDMQMHLGNQDINTETEEKLIVKSTALIPMEFSQENAVTETIAGRKAYIITDKQGYYSACIFADEEYIVIESHIRDKDKFLTETENRLK